MLPIAPLMIEHRLIERMNSCIAKELAKMRSSGFVNPVFLSTVTDFLENYADRCHHGKEEDILFRDLKKKPLSPEHKKIMEELLEDHKVGRKTAERLEQANLRYSEGDRQVFSEIEDCFTLLLRIYPKHIEKEDRYFFIPVMSYFDQKEKEAMLQECFSFDQKLFHEKYKAVVALAESSYKK